MLSIYIYMLSNAIFYLNLLLLYFYICYSSVMSHHNQGRFSGYNRGAHFVISLSLHFWFHNSIHSWHTGYTVSKIILIKYVKVEYASVCHVHTQRIQSSPISHYTNYILFLKNYRHTFFVLRSLLRCLPVTLARFLFVKSEELNRYNPSGFPI